MPSLSLKEKSIAKLSLQIGPRRGLVLDVVWSSGDVLMNPMKTSSQE